MNRDSIIAATQLLPLLASPAARADQTASIDIVSQSPISPATDGP